MGKYCTKERDQWCHPGSFDSAQDKLHAARRAVEGSRQGFTLMELMVYIAIVGIVVIVAGQAFSNSTKMRVRTQSMLKASEVAENVATLFKTDVAQMGAKSSRENANAVTGPAYGDRFYSVCAVDGNGCISREVYMDPDNETPALQDFSSFSIQNESENIDDVVFRRVRYSENGYYQAVEEIHWFVENKILQRSCVLRAKSSDYTYSDDDPCADVGQTPTPVEMASGVEKFTLMAAQPSAKVDEVQVFPPNNSSVFRLVSREGSQYMPLKVTNSSGVENVGGTSQRLDQFYSNYSNTSESIIEESSRKMNQVFAIKYESGATATSWNGYCTDYGSITLEKGHEYELSFNVLYAENESRMFVPGKDHMSVGFRDIATGDFARKDGKKLLDDFLFFPALDNGGGGVRSMRFTVPEDMNAQCIAFTFSCFSPLVAQGKLVIQDLKLNKVAESNYSFDPPLDTELSTNIKEKRNVKAVQLSLTIKLNGESGEATLVIPTPSNGRTD